MYIYCILILYPENPENMNGMVCAHMVCMWGENPQQPQYSPCVANNPCAFVPHLQQPLPRPLMSMRANPWQTGPHTVDMSVKMSALGAWCSAVCHVDNCTHTFQD